MPDRPEPIEENISAQITHRKVLAAEESPKLGTESLHIWRAQVDSIALSLPELESILSKEERDRANKFVHLKDRHLYSTSHYILRDLLSSYLNVHASEIEFSTTQAGKPFLKGSELKFNLSHSGNFTLIALSNKTEVGVDIERIDPDIEPLNLAKSFFSNDEYKEIAKSKELQQIARFYKCWAAKEAIIKADGRGLSMDLKSFSVKLGQRDSQIIYSSERDVNLDYFYLVPLEINPDYASAVATLGEKKNISLLEYEI